MTQVQWAVEWSPQLQATLWSVPPVIVEEVALSYRPLLGAACAAGSSMCCWAEGPNHRAGARCTPPPGLMLAGLGGRAAGAPPQATPGVPQGQLCRRGQLGRRLGSPISISPCHTAVPEYAGSLLHPLHSPPRSTPPHCVRRFEKAVLQVFGRTALCRSMDVAVQAARGNDVDCVTIDGDQVRLGAQSVVVQWW